MQALVTIEEAQHLAINLFGRECLGNILHNHRAQ